MSGSARDVYGPEVVAKPARIARAFSLNVEVCTIARSSELYVASLISSVISTAPTGTRPPLNAFANTIMSG